MSVDIEKLEQLAKKATPAPWHKQSFDVYGWKGKRRVFVTRTAPAVVKNSDDIHRFLNNSDYITAACNAVPELVKMYREAEGKANKAWKILLEAQARIVEVQKRVRELEKERVLIIHAIAGKYGRSEAVELQKFIEEAKAERAIKED